MDLTRQNNWIGLLTCAGMRATPQRLGVMQILFADGIDRHVTAIEVHTLCKQSSINLSLATVYNTLNALCEAKLLKQVSVDNNRIWYDTNTSKHFHLFDEDTGDLYDLQGTDLPGLCLPDNMAHKTIRQIDLVVRVGT